jgi:hypothetical protein
MLTPRGGCINNAQKMSIADAVTFSVPRSLVSEVVRLSEELTDRMHDLLERNTDGRLNPTERAELDTLVRMSEFGQIVSMALDAKAGP